MASLSEAKLAFFVNTQFTSGALKPLVSDLLSEYGDIQTRQKSFSDDISSCTFFFFPFVVFILLFQEKFQLSPTPTLSKKQVVVTVLHSTSFISNKHNTQ